jgi:hypothetical protein
MPRPTYSLKIDSLSPALTGMSLALNGGIGWGNPDIEPDGLAAYPVSRVPVSTQRIGEAPVDLGVMYRNDQDTTYQNRRITWQTATAVAAPGADFATGATNISDVDSVGGKFMMGALAT